MPKLSSKQSPAGVYRIVCERCGETAALSIGAPSRGSSAAKDHAVRCGRCNHGWFVPVTDAPVIFRRKVDRRAKLRDE